MRTLLIVGLVGSSVIHAAVVPEHVDQWPTAGSFFVVLTSMELAVAGLLWLGARAPQLVAAAAVSAGPLLQWLWSRSSGLPFGPEPGAHEAIGLADSAACLLEAVTLAVAVVLLRRGTSGKRSAPPSNHAARLALVAVIAVTTVGLAGTPLTWASVVADDTTHPGQDRVTSVHDAESS